MQSPRTRRSILQALAALGATAALPGRASTLGLADVIPNAPGGGGDRGPLAAARAAERWIARSRVPTAYGVTWAIEPNDFGANSLSLYAGVPGIVLFYMELYSATGDRAYLREAMAGADDIVARNRLKSPDPDERGLYMGLAGHVFVLGELGKLPGASRYTTLAKEHCGHLCKLARPVGAGVDWNTFNDIVYGNAGIGLALLYANQTWGDEEALAVAKQAGLRLIERGIPADGGLRWEMQPGYERYMPNFSHGTSGVGYYLATLYRITREQQFLDAALASTRHLKAIADTDNGICDLMHDDGEGKNIHYYGWCHGPSGTARLFYQLGKATGDPAWDEWVERCGQTILQSGIPEKRSLGFWNNVGACCGDSAVLQFSLDLYTAYGEERYLAFSQKMLADIYQRSSKDGNGLKWVHAEGRREPDKVAAQTGYMQGAAGIGVTLLRVDAVERGRKHIVLPDSPFPAA